MTTDEIGLNDHLAERGIVAHETDLAELIVQLAGDRPSHILVPAIHRNRSDIRDLFEAKLGERNLGTEAAELTAVARRHLQERFLRVRVGVSGANFTVADTGAVCVVESEGNGRMCTTLPHTVITVMGIEKVLARFADLVACAVAPAILDRRAHEPLHVAGGIGDARSRTPSAALCGRPVVCRTSTYRGELAEA